MPGRVALRYSVSLDGYYVTDTEDEESFGCGRSEMSIPATMVMHSEVVGQHDRQRRIEMLCEMYDKLIVVDAPLHEPEAWRFDSPCLAEAIRSDIRHRFEIVGCPALMAPLLKGSLVTRITATIVPIVLRGGNRPPRTIARAFEHLRTLPRVSSSGQPRSAMVLARRSIV